MPDPVCAEHLSRWVSGGIAVESFPPSSRTLLREKLSTFSTPAVPLAFGRTFRALDIIEERGDAPVVRPFFGHGKPCAGRRGDRALPMVSRRRQGCRLLPRRYAGIAAKSTRHRECAYRNSGKAYNPPEVDQRRAEVSRLLQRIRWATARSARLSFISICDVDLPLLLV